MRVLFEAKTEGSLQDRVEMEVWKGLGGLWQMELPRGFVPVEEERKRQYFPYDNSLETALFNEAEDAWITVQLFQKELKREETLEAMEKIRKLSADTWPQHKSTPVFLWSEGEIPVAWFAMTMEDMEKEHVKAVFSFPKGAGRMALLTFTYPEGSCRKWRPILEYLFSQIKEEKGEKDYGSNGKG